MKKVIVPTLAVIVVMTPISTMSMESAHAAEYKIVKGKLVNSKTGKVITKTVMYKSKLYKKGKLAKGKILYKKKLYVNGKILNKIVEFQNKYYKSGKRLNNSAIFIHNGYLHKGSTLYEGIQFYNNRLYKDGTRYTGVYNNQYYTSGTKTFEGNIPDNMIQVQYSKDKNSATVTYSSIPNGLKTMESSIKVSNASQISFQGGNGNSGTLVIKITDIQSNGSFNISLVSLNYGIRGELILNQPTSFKSLLQLWAIPEFKNLWDVYDKLTMLKGQELQQYVADNRERIQKALNEAKDKLIDNSTNEKAVYYAAVPLHEKVKVAYEKISGEVFN